MAAVWCRPCCFEIMQCCDSTMASVWIIAGWFWECAFVWKLFIPIPVCRDPSYIRVWMHCGVVWLLCVWFQTDRTIVWVVLCVHRVACRFEWFFSCLNTLIWAVYIFPGAYVVTTRLHPYVNVTWMHQANGICLGWIYNFIVSICISFWVVPVCIMPGCCGHVQCGDSSLAYLRFTACYILIWWSSLVSARVFGDCVCGKRQIEFWQIYQTSHQLAWCGLVDMAECVSDENLQNKIGIPMTHQHLYVTIVFILMSQASNI